MNNKLLIGILGKSDAGKSTTIYDLFGRRTRLVRHNVPLDLLDGKFVDVYFITSSAEEKLVDVDELIEGEPEIVICALQYQQRVSKTIEYFKSHGYDLVVVWLNPGYRQALYSDNLGIIDFLKAEGATVIQRDASRGDAMTVEVVRRLVRDWASSHGLLYSIAEAA